jgi:hypothetical protein
MSELAGSRLLEATPGFGSVLTVNGKFLLHLGLLVESNNKGLTTKNDPFQSFSELHINRLI